MRIPVAWWLVTAALLCGAQKASAGEGEINAQANECPTSLAASVFERADSTSRILGAIPDGNKVHIDSTNEINNFYRVQGDGYKGKLSGYVYKGCVTITDRSDDGFSSAADDQSEEPTPPLPADCSQFTDYLPGCKSFDEMLAAGDKDIVSKIRGLNEAYVCFRTGEDVFNIISVQKPGAYPFRKVPGNRFLVEMLAFATIARYKDGISEDWRIFRGKWSKTAAATPDQATFAGDGLNIDQNEISVAYKWKNLSNTVTSYRLQIRRSTKRVLETLEAPPAPTAKDRSTLHITFQGYCAEYNAE